MRDFHRRVRDSRACSPATRLAREAIEAADGLGDMVAAELFTAIAGAADKQLWRVAAHLQAEA
jgi:DNA-binding ferritin-like protein